MFGEYGSACLGRREAYRDEGGVGDVGGAAAGEERVGQSVQGNAVIEQAEAAADHGAARFERSPGEAEQRRDVVGVGADGLEELKVVADAEIQRKAWPHLPLVLSVEPVVGVALWDDRVAECDAKIRRIGDILQRI